MDLQARDLMISEFDTVSPDSPVADAVRLMRNPLKGGAPRRRVFGLMVVDERQQLVGMISMFDVLFHFDTLFHMETPGGGAAGEEDFEEAFYRACEKAGPMSVGDLMATPVVKVDEQAHITDIIDIMIKTRHRRLPVCRGNTICGVIYISDVFYEIYKNLLA